MEMKEKKIHRKINNLLFKKTISFFVVLILAQLYIINFTSNKDRILNALESQEGLYLKSVDMVPQYGEVLFSIVNDQYPNQVYVMMNDKKIGFNNNRLKINVRDGDLIEFSGKYIRSNVLIKVEKVSNNIININRDHIYEITPQSHKLILIKIRE
ncbi:MAG: hypothetical protein PWQ37_1854 [Candidatus Petromonas sp.]|jgi:hypothetical protein|nr:hypothetical protein [Candidatus Petromonas sp.]